jgi:hypothetical protein
MNALTVPEAHALATVSTEALMDRLREMEQSDCPVFHYFGEGIYIREVRMPAGTVAVGHIQKHEQMNVFVQGKVLTFNPDSTTTVLEAPMTFVGQPGRKVGVMLEDVIWQNIYPNPDNCRDIEELEDRWLDQTPCTFPKMLEQLQISEEQMWDESSVEDDLVPYPPGLWNSRLAVRQSSIHGKGLFAEANITAGEIICPARVQGKRTPAGRYTNHSEAPNAKPILVFGTDIGWLALRDIHGRRGGQNGEEITVDYREVRKRA